MNMRSKSRRRTDAVTGFVRFPIEDPDWKSTGEGGMFVRLVVVDRPDYGKKWSPCCGGSVSFLMDECLQGDDVNPEPEPWPESFEGMTPEEVARCMNAHPATDFHFPLFHSAGSPNDSGEDRYRSTGYLAVVNMGATGWSGHNEKLGYFRCRYENLTDDGKALYDGMKKLYPGCGLYLQTWLDT